MKKNDQFEVRITDISDEGAGIGRAGGLVWFIKDALPGDLVKAAATKLKKNYGFARLVQVLEPSKDRVEPKCRIARQCGGCQLQAMDYHAQLRFKEAKVLGNLKRIGGFALTDVTVEPIIGMEYPFRYRNKAQYPIGRDKDGRIIAGFYAGRTHSIIACEDCLLGCEENKDILEVILHWMEEFGIEPYDEGTGRGIVRHVLIRKAHASGRIMVCLVGNAEKLPHAEELVEALLRLDLSEAGVTSISYNINMERTNVIMGGKLINLYGPGYMEDSIRKVTVGGTSAAADQPDVPLSIKGSDGKAEQRPMKASMRCFEEGVQEGQPALRSSLEISQQIRFHISPLSFYQVNPTQMERLYSTALEYAGLTGRETVWDLYCGIGTISLFLAQKAKKVYGVEIIPQAIENARDNAALNGIRNTEFFVGKAEEVLPAWYEGRILQQGKPQPCEAELKSKAAGNTELCREQVDVIVVDPPRKGCDEKCLETMVKIAPERIVYVSCDSATLARDLRYLCANGYVLKKVRACDMFGQTVHVETIVLLCKVQN